MSQKYSLANRILLARKEARLSQKELAAAIRLSDKAISSYEVGRAVPPISVIKDIGRATFKHISYFVEDTDPNDFDLQLKLANIEKELLEVKKLLKRKDDSAKSPLS